MSLDRVRDLADAGRFLDAFAVLNGIAVPPRDKLASDLLRAELLERTGRHGQSLALISGLTAKRLTHAERSFCEFLLARIDYEAGDTDSALLHVQRSMALSGEGTDQSVRARALIWSMPLVAERSGSEALSPLVVETRKELTKLGDSRLWASFHVFAAQTDVKRGLSRNARRHVNIARNLLEKAPNSWVSAVLEGVQVAVALLECNLPAAERHSRNALSFADESGVAASQRTALGNLAYVLFTSGNFEESLAVIKRAFDAFPSAGSNHAAILETEAQIKLYAGQLDECEELLAKVEDTLKDPRDRVTSLVRGGAFTTTQLLLRRYKLREALDHANLTISLAEAAGDHFLEKHAKLARTEIQILGGDSDGAVLRGLSSFVEISVISLSISSHTMNESWHVRLPATATPITAMLTELERHAFISLSATLPASTAFPIRSRRSHQARTNLTNSPFPSTGRLFAAQRFCTMSPVFYSTPADLTCSQRNWRAY